MLAAVEPSKCASPDIAPDDPNREADETMMIKQTLTADKV
jgi:hypothetical protein